MTRRVVIVGGGFGGLAAARRLSRRDARGLVDVTLVDRSNHHTFSPLLYQVATAGLSPQDVGHSLRGMFARRPNVRFRLGCVTGADWGANVLHLARGAGVEFDHLVIAAGALSADFGIPGVAEHAFALKDLRDSVRLRNHILGVFERVSAHPELADEGALTFVVAGGGPTGVEVAGALAELVKHVMRPDFPELDLDRTRIVLVELAPSLLLAYSERSQRYAHEQLERRGVEVMLGVGVTAVTPLRVELTGGTHLPSSTLVWAGGVRANPLGEALGLDVTGGGRIVVGEDLRVPGRPNVLVVGDIAAIPDRGTGLTPQLAPVALQSGRHAAEEILRDLGARPARPFRYLDKGRMATIGRNAAVAELPGRVRFRGFVAWLAWLWLHLRFLIGFRHRASVVLQWVWSYLTYDRSARVVFDDWEATGSPTVPGSR